MKLIRDWALDGGQWFTRYTGADMGANGRGTSRKDYNSKTLIGIGENLEKLNIGRQAEERAMVARAKGDTHAPPLVGNHHFWRADVMTQQRRGYYASARMYSVRTRNTEWINGEALEDFYVADGANILMKSGLEYLDIYPIWDWQRIPGTTVELIPHFGPVPGKAGDAAPNAFIPNRNQIDYYSHESFVGGASDGMYGVFGGYFARHSLHVSKTWFFFDHQYVCLGSGLSCKSGNSVVTTLNQCFLHGPVTVSDANGIHTLARGAHNEPALNWVLHDGVGYWFAKPVHAQVNNQKQTGSWGLINTAYPLTPISGDVFKAWIDHGTNPTNASYAYTVVPNTNVDHLKSMAATRSTKVIRNTSDLQAVWNSKLRRGGAVFYKPASVTLRDGLKVSVNQPVMMLVADTGNAVKISVANPVNKPLTVHVDVNRDGKTAAVDIVLPGGDMAGSTVTHTLPF